MKPIRGRATTSDVSSVLPGAFELHEFEGLRKRSPSDKVGLSSLPYDLLLNIANYLELNDVHNLHLTCKSLHDFSQARPVYRKLATDLLRRCRALPLKGFQQLTDLTTDQLIRSVNKATRYERAWRSRTPRPIAGAPSSNYMDGEGNSWYKIVRAPPGEDVDWLSPITSSYTLCATKRGKVVCWDVQTDQCLAEWNPGEKWELWKCRVEFEQRTVYFTMAKILSGSHTDDRVMEFILMRLTFSDGPSGETSKVPPVFSHVTDFRTSGVVMNVFLLDPSIRLLSAFIWVSGSNTIGLYALPDWDEPEYVFIDTGIECVPSANWSCILFEDHIVIHCEESDAAYQHFYPISLLRQFSKSLPKKTSAPSLSYLVPPPRTLSKKFTFPVLPRESDPIPPPLHTNGIPVNGTAGVATTIVVGQQPNGTNHAVLPALPTTPSLPNPFPVPPWCPESAHFVRQWWPTIPGIPRVSCTVVLLAAQDHVTRQTRFVLAQHYFRVPLNHAQWFHPEPCKFHPDEFRSCECEIRSLTPAQRALVAQDEALMHMWYVSAPFEVVRILETTIDEGDEEQQERPRPLIAVDFGHAVWVEYCDPIPSTNGAGAGAGGAGGGGGADEGMEGDVDDVGGDTEPESEEKWLRFVTFPTFKDEFEYVGLGEEDKEKWVPKPRELEGKVRTLEIPDELDLGTVETINIDQSQGAVILSDKDGKIYILCYE